MFYEDVIEFGQDKKLIGVLSRPEKTNANIPAVVIINSGALHRVGACRSSVLLARTLAESGYLCFRFDLYGIGDSGFGGNMEDDILHTKHEISEALDELQRRYSVNQFVLHGLCSGARDALASAVKDKRIVGLSMIDGYAFRTTRHFLTKLSAFLSNPAAWINFIRVRIKPTVPAHETSLQSELLEIPFWPEYPPKTEVSSAFQTLANREVKMLVTYTGSWADEYNYEGQFFDMFSEIEFHNSISENFMPQADHMMTDLDDQQRLRQAVLSFLSSF